MGGSFARDCGTCRLRVGRLEFAVVCVYDVFGNVAFVDYDRSRLGFSKCRKYRLDLSGVEFDTFG